MPSSYEQYVLRTHNRREFLRRFGVVSVGLGGASLLAACGSSSSAGSSGGSSGAGGTPTIGGTVDMLWWQGYEMPGIITPWLKQHNVKLHPTFINTADDVQAKILAGDVSYDLSGYAQLYKSFYKELGVYQPIDESQVPNIANLLPLFAGDVENFWVDADGTRTGVPWQWGTIGLNYDSSVIGPLKSYGDLLASSIKGKVGVVDDFAAVQSQACRYLHLQEDKVPKDKLSTVKDFLSALVAQSKGVSPSYGDLTTRFAAGDVVAAFPGWAAVDNFAAAAGKKTIKTDFPKEGGITFVDSWMIPKTADNVDAALGIINQSITPMINGKLTTRMAQASPVKGAEAFIPPSTMDLYPYAAMRAGSLQTVAAFQKLPPQASDQFVTFKEMLNMWQDVKLGA
jgi:spermidine/putrescine-binding protein